jgi:hypothetical protein
VRCASRERDKLQIELARTSATVAELSLRLSGSAGKGNGKSEGAASLSDASTSELMPHINRLQQQLYVEREKNKRLKGG